MEALEIQKLNQKKYALISLLQILFIISLPTYLRLTQELQLKTGIKYSVLCFIAISIWITARIKSRIKLNISTNNRR